MNSDLNMKGEVFKEIGVKWRTLPEAQRKVRSQLLYVCSSSILKVDFLFPCIKIKYDVVEGTSNEGQTCVMLSHYHS